MTLLLIHTLTGLLLGSAQDHPPEDPPAELTHELLDTWKTYLTPRSQEREWLRIPWRKTLGDALQEGFVQDKPVFLWAMNGHPLGNT